ncbi:hypothetical protein DV735_g4585, partial [Chaetothyriales sp. CBS 134920]
MKYSVSLVALASLAAAQTATTSAASTTTSSSCAAQNILDACIATIQGQINSCATTDYSCLCTQYVNLLTCYNNCPSDVGVGTVQQLRQQNCNAASVYGSTTTLQATWTSEEASSTATETSADSTATATSSEAVETGFASGSGSSTATSSSSTSSSTENAAAIGAEVASGLLAIVAAGFGLLL